MLGIDHNPIFSREISGLQISKYQDPEKLHCHLWFNEVWIVRLVGTYKQANRAYR